MAADKNRNMVSDPPQSARDRLLWSEPGELRHEPVALVAVRAPMERLYSFAVPESMRAVLRPGMRVRVALGKRGAMHEGWCVERTTQPWDSSLRPIAERLDDHPLLDAALLELGRWIAAYYAAPLGPTLSAMVPAAAVEQRGLPAIRYVRLVEGAPGPEARGSPKRDAVVAALRHRGGEAPVAEVCRAAGCTDAVIRSAVKAGVLAVEARRELPAFEPPPNHREEPGFALTDDQVRAVERLATIIDAGIFRAVLLFGVTGSGKTEVYVRAARRVIAAGRQVVVLVPEIALTTQTIMRLARRFERVAVLHSGLTEAQRSRTWAQIADGQIDVVIGTRSAVFAPLPQLGMVIVDEEQEPSYKNLAAPRFGTRDVAIKRCQLAGVPIVLGTATPSLETWLNAQTLKHYEAIRLPRRVAGLPLPQVHLVDLSAEQRQRKGIHLLGRLIESELRRTFDAGGQAVLLLNRRGFASYLVCARCRRRIVCPNCGVNMVLHHAEQQGERHRSAAVRCHYCSARIPLPQSCPDERCGGKLIRFGMGTQRVEEELQRKFPGVRVRRADSDTMLHPREYRALIEAFEARELDVLLGTQMVAKGLDFPFVAFVGVVSADTTLAIPDFRATERTFQLVTQVAGRAGRAGSAGTVVVQTFNPALPAIKAAVSHDYEWFARDELPRRKAACMPPYWRLTRIVLADGRRSRALAAANDRAARIRAVLAETKSPAGLLGPAPSPMKRMRNLYRFDLLLRAPTPGDMQRLLDRLRRDGVFRPTRVKQLTVDVDPVSLM